MYFPMKRGEKKIRNYVVKDYAQNTVRATSVFGANVVINIIINQTIADDSPNKQTNVNVFPSQSTTIQLLIIFLSTSIRYYSARTVCAYLTTATGIRFFVFVLCFS